MTTQVWERGPSDQGLRLTLLALADRMDDHGVTLPRFGGVQEIANRICKTQRQAIRNLRKLESQGWLTVDRRAVLRPGVQGAQNRYRMSVGKLGGIGDTTMSHAHQVSDDITVSPITEPVSDTAMSLKNRVSGDISIPDHVTSGDISGSHNNRKNVERNYNVVALAAELASKERSLQGERVSSALQQELESEIRTGAEPVAAGNTVLSQVRRYIGAQRNGHFTIHGWSVTNLLAGGNWRDEQSWPWKPEHRPEPKRRYVDLTRLYDGPEYQPTAALARSHLDAETRVFSPLKSPQISSPQKVGL